MERKKLKKALLLGAGAIAGIQGAKLLSRGIINRTHDKILKILMEDKYDENLWELISAVTRIGLQNVLETNLRATEGKAIERPMGSPKKFPSLDDLVFTFAQLHNMPTPLEEKIDMSVVIGKKAKRPFTVSIPIIIAPMAYGEALSKEAKIALAKGSALAGTATNTGEGPFLPEERAAAKFLIYQYNRGDWGKTPEIIRQCDAVEIQLGQGAIGGVGHVIAAKDIDKQLRKDFAFPKGKPAIAHSRQAEVKRPADLVKLVNKIKDIGGGIPVGVKMAAGKHLEADLRIACEAGVDFISLEGAEAATKASAPILQDDFGIPIVFAISRAATWLKENGYKDRVTLIASGKMRTPGDVLKACALGADAVYMGAVALFAFSHTQVLYPLPFEPPTQVVWYHGKFAKKFKIKDGVKYLAQFLQSCKEEIELGIKALGKTSLAEVGREDLMALNELISQGCQIPLVYEPFTAKN
ncbi:MAG: FMN-binding glutamate synthase family protein [Firmicutes bacterium]|nr:FMN-binding glutamate synthase family protein [Bacillota bacterium]